MTNDKKCFIAGAALISAALCVQWAARSADGAATWYAHHIYPALVGAIGRFCGAFSFSVVEMGLYLLIFTCIVYAARHFREPVRLVSRTVLLGGILLFSYTCCCGVNYYAASFSGYAGIETGLYTKEELTELCRYLVKMVNETAMDESYKSGANRKEWRAEGVRAMQKAGEEFHVLGGFYPKPKEVTISWILSV